MKWIRVGILAVTVLIGLAWCFAGYRLIKPVLFLAVRPGFALFFYVTYNILAYQAADKLANWVQLAIAAGAGILGGIMLVLVFKIGVFVMGFIFGAVLAALVVAFIGPLNRLLVQSVSGSAAIWVFVACIVGLGIVCGIAAVIFTRPIFIFVTAWNGAFLVMSSIDNFTQWNIIQAFTRIFMGAAIAQANLNWASYKTYVIIGGIIVLGLVGIVTQARLTAKNHHHDPANRKPKGQDEIPLLEP